MASKAKLTKEEYNRRRRERYAENREKINERRRFLYQKKKEKKQARSEAAKRAAQTRRIKKWDIERRSKTIKEVLKQVSQKQILELALKQFEEIKKERGWEWETIQSAYWKQFREEYARRKK